MRKIIFLISFLSTLIVYPQDGSLDVTFTPELSTNMYIERVMIQSDNKIIIQEHLESIPYRTRITRLLNDGFVDISFNCSLGTDKPLNLGAIQSDGKIIIFQNNLATNKSLIYRLNPNGSLDQNFVAIGADNGHISSVIVQPDNKIVIGGSFSVFNNSAANRIVRLESDGSIDLSFQFLTPSNSVNNIKLLNNAKFLVNNYFMSNWTSTLIRINSNGTIDSNFTNDTNCFGYNYFLQSDEKIINEDFCTDWGFDAPPYEILYRLNSDGSYDETFNRLGFDSSYPFNCLVQKDDKILVTGFFNSYNNHPIQNILRLLPDGELDGTFDGGSGPNDEVWDLAQQSDGKIIIVGLFTQYNNSVRNHIARINSARLSLNESQTGTVQIYPNPVKDVLNLSLSDVVSAKEYEIYDLVSKKIAATSLKENNINVSNLSNGVYILKIKTDEGVLTGKFVKQ